MTERAAPPATADLLDAHPDLAVCEPALVSFGGVAAFCGPIATVVAPEDNADFWMGCWGTKEGAIRFCSKLGIQNA